MITVEQLNEIWKDFCTKSQVEWILKYSDSQNGIEKQNIFNQLEFERICPTQEGELEGHHPSHYLLVRIGRNTFKFFIVEWQPKKYHLNIKKHQIHTYHHVPAYSYTLMESFDEIGLANLLPEIIYTLLHVKKRGDCHD